MALYAYAVVGHAPDLDELDIETVGAGPVRAVVGEVDVADFEGERLERHLQDPAWLESTVRDHEAVVERIQASAPVVPMRFGSIFSTREALESMLAANVEQLEALLDRVRDREEWSVKVRADVAAAARAAAPTSEGGGRAYLERRRDQQQTAEDMRAGAAASAGEAYRRLRLLADDAVSLTIRPSPGPGVVVLNAAYLVARPAVDDFLAGASEVDADLGPGFDLVVSGPWPPYSFTNVDVAGAR